MLKWSPSQFWESTPWDAMDAMQGFNDFYQNDIRFHASIHGVKMPKYISHDEIVEKANRLEEILEQELLEKQNANS